MIALVGELPLPENVLATCRVVRIGARRSIVDADIAFVPPGGLQAYSASNPKLPVFALEGRRLVALALYGSHLVPHTPPEFDDLLEFIQGVVRAMQQLRPSDPPPTVRRLTPRERDVLERLALGHSAKTVARDLGISHHTVRQHVANAKRKLGAPNQTVAVLTAARLGLLRK